MDHVVAFFEFSEIDFEGRTHRGGVRRFQAARTLHFIATEYFDIGDDDQFGLVVEKTSGERPEVQSRGGVPPPFILC